MGGRFSGVHGVGHFAAATISKQLEATRYTPNENIRANSRCQCHIIKLKHQSICLHLSHSSAPPKHQVNPSNTLSHSQKHPDDSPDEEGLGNPSKQSKPSSDPDDVHLLACSYFKLDPARYSEANILERNYRGCSSVYLRDIARVKQQFYRVHQQPRNLCPRCSALFPNA